MYAKGSNALAVGTILFKGRVKRAKPLLADNMSEKNSMGLLFIKRSITKYLRVPFVLPTLN